MKEDIDSIKCTAGIAKVIQLSADSDIDPYIISQ
uniref:Uncharacterized protein n=1 Tax=viral metagenome TaxID=1070528 RepID=A0A6C0IAV0_9ZZZZ